MGKLVALYAKMEEVPEALRDFYVAKDGAAVLDVTPVNGYALENVAGLKNALESEKEERRKKSELAAAFGDLDPKMAKEAVEWRKKFGDLDPAKEADKIADAKFQELKSQLVGSHQGELDQKDSKIKNLSTEIERLLIDTEATAAIARAGGKVDLLLPHVKQRLMIRQDGEQFVREVIDPATRRARVNSKAEPLNIDELMAEMKANDVFGLAFEGSGASGSGAGGSGTKPGSGGGAGGPKHRGDFTDTKSKAAWINQNPGKFDDLPMAPVKEA